mgnify:CR=1 FL=1
MLLTTLSVLIDISSEFNLLYDAIFYYVKVTPVTPWVDDVAIISLEISTGIVTLAPESTPSSVIVVNNFVLFPNSVVLLIADKLNDVPLIVSLNADEVNGLTVVEAPPVPTPVKFVNNLL